MVDFEQAVIGFLCCTLVIVFSGIKLVKYGDTIAELTGFGRVWVGMVLMAAVTSLPELMTGLSAVTVVDAPDLAVGDVLGSCMFNLLILSFIDVRISRPITSLVRTGHLFSGLCGIILVAVVGVAIVTAEVTPVWFWFSPVSLLLIGLYLFTIWGAYQREIKLAVNLVPVELAGQERTVLLKDAIRLYLLNGLLVVMAAYFLPLFGKSIASGAGLNNTFFGTLFLAASTSLPEIVVSFAAIRMASYDLLMGNLLGSNLFNIFILALDDLAYMGGSLFANIAGEHLESVMVIILMTAIVGLGVLVKPSRRIWRLGLDTAVVLLLYVGLITRLFFNS